MRGRFVQRPILDFGLPSLVDLAPALAEIPPSYNLAPTQRASVILDRGTGRQVSRLAWGLLPFWAKAKNLQGVHHQRPHRDGGHQEQLPGRVQEAQMLGANGGLLRVVDERGGR
jgi:hypothetical protein